MVPMDQPKHALEMLYRWTRGSSLDRDDPRLHISERVAIDSPSAVSI